MTTTRHCPALLVTAPASGQGKTTLVAALARRHRNLGRRVRVFKVGPAQANLVIPAYRLEGEKLVIGEDG